MVYRFVDHTADVAFEVTAATLEELFRSAAEATVATMVENPEAVRPQVRRPVRLEAAAPDLLLFHYLQELIFYKDAEGLLLRPLQLTIEQVGDSWRLEGMLAGEPIDPGRHRTLTDVKAVTLHRFEVTRTSDGWRGFVILDV
ncbi:MAG: archease [Acidobacteriota bacterium]